MGARVPIDLRPTILIVFDLPGGLTQPRGRRSLSFVYPMSNSYLAGHNRGQKSRHLNGGASLLVARAPIESDEIGVWSREDLIRMDTDFCAAVERAIARGLEQRRSARATFPGRAA